MHCACGPKPPRAGGVQERRNRGARKANVVIRSGLCGRLPHRGEAWRRYARQPRWREVQRPLRDCVLPPSCRVERVCAVLPQFVMCKQSIFRRRSSAHALPLCVVCARSHTSGGRLLLAPAFRRHTSGDLSLSDVALRRHTPPFAECHSFDLSSACATGLRRRSTSWQAIILMLVAHPSPRLLRGYGLRADQPGPMSKRCKKKRVCQVRCSWMKRQGPIKRRGDEHCAECRAPLSMPRHLWGTPHFVDEFHWFPASIWHFLSPHQR